MMINNAFVEQQLSELLKNYQASNVRYRQMGFSCKEPKVLNELIGLLKNHLSQYSVWHGFESYHHAPLAGCSRFEFVKSIFNQNSGLLLCYPDRWLSYWTEADKQAFWRTLSDRSSPHGVVVVFLESPEFFQLNQGYFVAQTLANTAVNVWVSSRLALV